ncbi:FecR family protein [Parabacteroides faecis]|uniref:Ferric-dicitrate binding protein FerR (Iron transport regulator) n=1 Tax=Parabacteroides faecis TaxID=1217282 RepID=A0ABR6KQN7_9BACT|nr:FecR family protein [Parabacteroides faecis]MBB4623113.1 ferric-dicitrate binding protein FerR (iron transport regulator) [Parabacteroides faecis]GGK19852.1 iron dicitrate transporter FecR [Parabacteroides faecis]
MNKNKIDILLNKYLKGTISREEAEDLQELSNLCKNNELKEAFRKQWDKYQLSPEMNFPEIRDISNKIHKSIHATRKKYIINIWTRIAVSILLIVTTGLSVFLMIDDKQMQTLGEREIITQVDKGQRANITLPDGTTVQLNSESTLSYRQDFGIQNREVKFNGEGFFQVTKNPDKKFIVNTQYMDVEVLGTSFNFFAYESKDIVEVTLVEGKVFLYTNTSPRQTTILEPNNKAIYNKNTGRLNVEQTNTTFETAWRATELAFRTEPLTVVLAKIERKYGVIINIENEQLFSEFYTGVFEKEDLTEVMKVLHAHFQFTYKIKGDTISIK